MRAIERPNCCTVELTLIFPRYYGGSLNLLDDAGFKGWMPTIIKDPWLFRGNLKPIYELILDESKKREMKLAVQVHLDKAYLVVSVFNSSRFVFSCICLHIYSLRRI